MSVLVTPRPPSYGANMRKQYRVLRNNFGDGYEQIIPDGLNNQIQEWDLSWELNAAEALSLESQLNSFEGKDFQWTTPNGNTLRFNCYEYTKSFIQYDNYVITAKFIQSFNL